LAFLEGLATDTCCNLYDSLLLLAYVSPSCLEISTLFNLFRNIYIMEEKKPSPPPQRAPSSPSKNIPPPIEHLNLTQTPGVSTPAAAFEIRVEEATPKLTSPIAQPLKAVNILRLDEVVGSPIIKLTREEMQAEIDSLLIYTKAVKWPTVYASLTEKRFINRVLQLLFGLVAFLNLGYTALASNYTSLVLDSSGIPFFCFVSITSIVSFYST
jgi:hypothetical protein